MVADSVPARSPRAIHPSRVPATGAAIRTIGGLLCKKALL
jgi:hypothetical protein